MSACRRVWGMRVWGPGARCRVVHAWVGGDGDSSGDGDARASARGRCRAVCAGVGFGLTATSGSTTPARAAHAGASVRARLPGACGRGLPSKGRRVCACGMCGAICASGVIDGVARAESRAPSRLFRITAYARGRLPLRCLRVARAGRPSARGSFWRAPAPCTASLLLAHARGRLAQRPRRVGPQGSPRPFMPSCGRELVAGEPAIPLPRPRGGARRPPSKRATSARRRKDVPSVRLLRNRHRPAAQALSTAPGSQPGPLARNLPAKRAQPRRQS